VTENEERGIRIAGYSKAVIKFTGTAIKCMKREKKREEKGE
jgi:hypothetical protein